MDDQDEAVPAPGSAGNGEGTSAVLYGMFTTFTEVLGNLENRLESIEGALRPGLGVLEGRLASIEAALHELSEAVRLPPVAAERPSQPVSLAPSAEVAEVGAVLRAQSELVDHRMAALAGAVDDLRALLQAHVDDAAQSLGRRVGEVGRRLATDLGLRSRPKPPPFDR